MKPDLKRELYAEFLGTLVLIAFGAGVSTLVRISGAFRFHGVTVTAQ